MKEMKHKREELKGRSRSEGKQEEGRKEGRLVIECVRERKKGTRRRMEGKKKGV